MATKVNDWWRVQRPPRTPKGPLKRGRWRDLMPVGHAGNRHETAKRAHDVITALLTAPDPGDGIPWTRSERASMQATEKLWAARVNNEPSAARWFLMGSTRGPTPAHIARQIRGMRLAEWDRGPE
jgi:hypothetical protein